MEKVTKDRVVGVTLLILLLACVYLLDTSFPNMKSTLEYKEGYSLGYSEHNATKNQAACDIYFYSWGFEYTDGQYDYAYGYHRGYKAYMDDESDSLADNKRNETARILGV